MSDCPHTHDFGCPYCYHTVGCDLCATGDEIDCECEDDEVNAALDAIVEERLRD